MVKLVAGSGLIVLALFMFVGSLNVNEPMGTWVKIATFAITVVLPAGGGGLLLASHFRGGKNLARRKDLLKFETQQSEVIRLAAKHGGKLTAVEVIGETGMVPGEVDTVFRELVARGLADVEVSDAGLVVYAFPEVMALPDKDTSRGVLDG